MPFNDDPSRFYDPVADLPGGTPSPPGAPAAGGPGQAFRFAAYRATPDPLFAPSRNRLQSYYQPPVRRRRFPTLERTGPVSADAGISDIGMIGDVQRRMRNRVAEAQAPGATSFNDVWGLVSGGGADIGDLNRLAVQLLGGQGAGTAFDPTGDPATIRALREEAMQNAQALQAQAANYAAWTGADPGTQNYARLQSVLNTQGGVANALNTARREAATRSADLRRQILMAILSSNLGLGRQNNAYSWQQVLQDAAQGGGLGELLGGIAGRAGGAWLSPGGIGG